MSNKAIKAITEAAEIAQQSPEFFVEFIRNKEFRKIGKWKNSEALAALIIESITNAVIYETLMRSDKDLPQLDDSIENYTSSNMDDWNGEEWTCSDIKGSLEKLQDAVNDYTVALLIR